MSQYQKGSQWDVPYLTIDPEDIGKEYQAIIRINSQSGKGGVAYVLEQDYQCVIPKTMQADIASFIQKKAELTGSEIHSKEVWNIFNQEFINRSDNLKLEKIRTELLQDESVQCELDVYFKGAVESLVKKGNGPLDAAKKALLTLFPSLTIQLYSEHSLSQGSDSSAICYITILYNNQTHHGVGLDTNITIASVRALFSAINRGLEEK